MKVKRVAPGTAEGATFQQYCHVKKINATDAVPTNPTPVSAPAHKTVQGRYRLDRAKLLDTLRD